MEKYIGLGVLALLVLGFIVTVFLAKKRKKELKQLADTLHFSFDDEFTDEDDALLKSLNHLTLFRQSRSQGAWNVMRGQTDDIAVTIMDHRYSSGSSSSGRTRKVSEQTVIVLQSDLLSLPSFTLRPEDLAHKISTAMLGYRDINFDDHPAFSKRYHLHGNDEESIRQIFSEGVLAYFEQQGKVMADGSGDSLLFCRLGKTVAAKDIKSFLELGFEVFILFKTKSGKNS